MSIMTGALNPKSTVSVNGMMTEILLGGNVDSLLTFVTDHTDLKSTDDSFKVAIAKLSEGGEYDESEEADDNTNTYIRQTVTMNKRYVGSFDSTGLSDIVDGAIADAKLKSGYTSALEIIQRVISKTIYTKVNAVATDLNATLDGTQNISADILGELFKALTDAGATSEDIKVLVLNSLQYSKVIRLPEYATSTSNLSVTVDGRTMKVSGTINGFNIVQGGNYVGMNCVAFAKKAVHTGFKAPVDTVDVNAKAATTTTYVNVWGNISVVIPELCIRAKLAA